MTDDAEHQRHAALDDARDCCCRAASALRAAHGLARDRDDAGRLGALHAALADVAREIERLRT